MVTNGGQEIMLRKLRGDILGALTVTIIAAAIAVGIGYQLWFR